MELLSDGAEEVFVESPIEEGTDSGYGDDIHQSELADGGYRFLSSGDGTIFGVGEDEEAEFVAVAKVLGALFAGKQDGLFLVAKVVAMRSLLDRHHLLELSDAHGIQFDR